MVYLSSPEGGRTVFPGQGLEEEAVEGDALLWHGMRADQKKDARGLHLACPILAGGCLPVLRKITNSVLKYLVLFWSGSKWMVNLGVNLLEGWEGSRRQGVGSWERAGKGSMEKLEQWQALPCPRVGRTFEHL